MSRLEFGKLLGALFVSQVGSHFLTLSLAAIVLYQSGSPLHSAAVFVCSSFPAVLFSARLGALLDRHLSKVVLVGNEILAILITGLCAVAVMLALPLSVVCLLLSVRSICLLLGRTAALRWLKEISPQGVQVSRNKIFFLTFFLSTAVSGALASLVLGKLTIVGIAAIDISTYLVGTIFLLTLKPIQVGSSGAAKVPLMSLPETLREIMVMPDLARAFGLVLISQAIFQGAYSALVSVLPRQVFHLGIDGVGSFQLAASFGIIAGFVVNWLRPKGLNSSQERRAYWLPILILVGAGGARNCKMLGMRLEA